MSTSEEELSIDEKDLRMEILSLADAWPFAREDLDSTKAQHWIKDDNYRSNYGLPECSLSVEDGTYIMEVVKRVFVGLQTDGLVETTGSGKDPNIVGLRDLGKKALAEWRRSAGTKSVERVAAKLNLDYSTLVTLLWSVVTGLLVALIGELGSTVAVWVGYGLSLVLGVFVGLVISTIWK